MTPNIQIIGEILMKKKLKLVGLIIIVITLVNVISDIESHRINGVFNLAEYEIDIKQYNENFNKEKVPDTLVTAHTAKNARDIAQVVWLDIYGNHVLRMKPYKVYYDEDYEMWLVIGRFSLLSFGGEPYLLIRKDGKIIAVWHTK